jgi:hypothetical protein
MQSAHGHNPPSFMIIFGIALILFFAPAFVITLSIHDSFLPSLGILKNIISAFEGMLFLVGIVLAFCGVRTIAMAGSTAYRITHPRLWRNN